MSKNIARIRIIQFSPDREVGEVLNVGLVGVCGEVVDVRWARNTEGIKAVFGREAANVVESIEEFVRSTVAVNDGSSDQPFDCRSLAADGGTSLLLGPEVVVTAEDFEEAMLRIEARFLKTANSVARTKATPQKLKVVSIQVADAGRLVTADKVSLVAKSGTVKSGLKPYKPKGLRIARKDPADPSLSFGVPGTKTNPA